MKNSSSFIAISSLGLSGALLLGSTAYSLVTRRTPTPEPIKITIKKEAAPAPTPTPTPETPKPVIPTPTTNARIFCPSSQRVNLRSLPNRAVITTIRCGEQVEAIAGFTEWTAVRYQSQNGFVFSKYVQCDPLK